MMFLAAVAALQVGPQSPVPRWTAGPGTPGISYEITGTGSATDTIGAVLSVRSTTAPVTAFGSVQATLGADSFRLRKVRLVAEIEAHDVAGGASPWLRVDGPGGALLMFDNAADRALKGTRTGRFETILYVPSSATRIVFGLLLAGSGEATARGVRIEALPFASAGAPIAASARQLLDTAYSIVRHNSLWRDTVTWSSVEPDFYAMAAGALTSKDAYPAIRYLLARLGDHHSFLMQPSGAESFRTGGAANPRSVVRLQEAGIGYISVPAYSGGEEKAMHAFAKQMQDSTAAIVANARCGWIVDLRENMGGNMWPMLGGLRPFLGDAGLGSFVSAGGSAPLWRAKDGVNIKPGRSLRSLESAYVAVLTGPLTASSGEAVTISFRGRPHTRSFGLPTGGYSTANQDYALPDSSMIFLTTAVEADRTGQRYGDKIVPDETIPRAGATADPQLERAIAWLRLQPGCEQGAHR